jgi:hypothetical protein
MFSLKFKILLAGSLLLVTAVLFAVKLNFSDDDANGEEYLNPADTMKAEHYKALVPPEIDTLLFSFGIKKEWIKNAEDLKEIKNTKKVKKEEPPPVPENLWFYKEVLIPPDLSASALNYELTNFLHAMKLSEIINEDPKTRDLTVDVYHSADQSKKIMGKVRLIYSDKVSRDAAEVCIILNNVKQYSQANLEKILGSPEKFSLILPVNFENSDLQSSITESGKDYLLYYSIGNENDFEADFRLDMDEKQWKGKVRSVAVEFPEASGVLIADNRNLFKFEADIIDHFVKYRPNVFRDSIVYKFEPGLEGEKKIYDLFSNILTKSASGRKSLIYLVDFTYTDFVNYTGEVYNMKKRGYRFMNFKEIMRSRNKIKEPGEEKFPIDSLKTKNDITGKGKTK